MCIFEVLKKFNPLNSLVMQVEYKVEYIDIFSRGHKCETSISGEDMTEQDVIDWFGLDGKEVLWYKITKQ